MNTGTHAGRVALVAENLCRMNHGTALTAFPCAACKSEAEEAR